MTPMQPTNRTPTAVEETLILNMHSNELTQHVLGIYLRDRSKYDQLWNIFGKFHEMLDGIEPRHDKMKPELKCPAGTYPCGPNRCCIPTKGSDWLKDAMKAEQ